MPFGPTPDFDRKTVAWYGVNTDGTPCTGSITLMYEGPVMLDPGSPPISVYPKKITTQLSTQTITITQESGSTTQIVGYASFSVPASNDPDLVGSGGTYRVVEDLDEGNGLSKSVVIDRLAAGTIYLNQLTGQDAVVPESVFSTTGLVYSQAFSDSSRKALPSGAVLMILGGSAAQKPVWAQPGDLYAATS